MRADASGSCVQAASRQPSISARASGEPNASLVGEEFVQLLRSDDRERHTQVIPDKVECRRYRDSTQCQNMQRQLKPAGTTGPGQDAGAVGEHAVTEEVNGHR